MIHYYHIHFELFTTTTTTTSTTTTFSTATEIDSRNNNTNNKNNHPNLHPQNIFDASLYQTYRTEDSIQLLKHLRSLKKSKGKQKLNSNNPSIHHPHNYPPQEIHQNNNNSHPFTDYRFGALSIEWMDQIEHYSSSHVKQHPQNSSLNDSYHDQQHHDHQEKEKKVSDVNQIVLLSLDENGTSIYPPPPPHSSQSSSDNISPTKHTFSTPNSQSRKDYHHPQHHQNNNSSYITTSKTTSSSTHSATTTTKATRIKSNKSSSYILSTSGKFVPFKQGKTLLNAGILHLFKNKNEVVELLGTEGIDVQDSETNALKGQGNVLAFLAVPSYMTAQDFLNFLGPHHQHVQHIRIVRDAIPNRYLALVKLRTRQSAEQIYKRYNRQPFNSMEPEVCQVVFIKSIEFDSKAIAPYAFPASLDELHVVNSLSSALSVDTKTLIELPTCPVCLERLDASVSGLLTILCQHTFHCSCLARWEDSSCPVCRYSQKALALEDFVEENSSSTTATESLGGTGVDGHGENHYEVFNVCTSCQTINHLWICLICGHIGCGRYQGGHAQEHFVETSHLYALELETQRVWDYAGDGYVHRLIQNKADGKLVEVSAPNLNTLRTDYLGHRGRDSSHRPVLSTSDHHHQQQQRHGDFLSFGDGGTGSDLDQEDYNDIEWSKKLMNIEKLDAITMEYTYLLTSQLETQRLLYETQINSLQEGLTSKLSLLKQENEDLKKELQSVVQSHQYEKSGWVKQMHTMDMKLNKVMKKFQDMESALDEEKSLNKVLISNQEEYQMKIEHLDGQIQERNQTISDLQEQVKDLMFFLETRDKIEDEHPELQQGSLVISSNHNNNDTNITSGTSNTTTISSSNTTPNSKNQSKKKVGRSKNHVRK